MREHGKNQRSQRESEPQPLDPFDYSDLRHPERTSPFLQQRLLHDAYVHFASKSFVGPHEMVWNRNRFMPEDIAAFSRLESHIRRGIAATLSLSSAELTGEDVSIRALHHAVGEGKGGRERHIYVEVLRGRHEWILALNGTVERFSHGPVALQVFSQKRGTSEGFEAMPLLSQAAFNETARNMVHTIQSNGGVTPTKNWAFKWILSALTAHEEVVTAAAAATGGSTANLNEWFKRISLSPGSLQGKEAVLKFDVGKLSVIAELTFNERLQHPDVTLKFGPH
jgi:hypothetical protein